MLNTILTIASMYGTSFLIKEASIFDRQRNFLISISPFFARLLMCYACVGIYSGCFVYFLSFDSFSFRQMIMYSISGSVFSLIISLIVDRIAAFETK
jgi:uncharacterized membrane protein